MKKSERKELHARVKELFKTVGVDRITEQPEQNSSCSRINGSLSSPYGLIRVTFYNAYDAKSNPWLACQLACWDAPQGVFRWYGWHHWKQNRHINADHGVTFIIEAFRDHLDSFFRDRGKGFPSPTVFDAYEIRPCVISNVGSDDEFAHPCESEREAYDIWKQGDKLVWSLYGHLPTGGVDCICDRESKRLCLELYERITGVKHTCDPGDGLSVVGLPAGK